jgi:hypothetical protein
MAAYILEEHQGGQVSNRRGEVAVTGTSASQNCLKEVAPCPPGPLPTFAIAISACLCMDFELYL